MTRVFCVLSILALASLAAAAAAFAECPPNPPNISCCGLTDGRGCHSNPRVSWRHEVTGSWPSQKDWCYPEDVNWCQNNERIPNYNQPNYTICYLQRSGQGDQRCCHLKPSGC